MEPKENKPLTYDVSPTEESIVDEPRNWKEKQYEKLRGKLPVRWLDLLIAVLIIAFVVVIVLGYLKGHPA